MEHFSKNVINNYGDKISDTVHNLLHLTDWIQRFGRLDNLAGYTFQNHMQYVKKKITRQYLVLQQLSNRIF